MEIYGIPLVVVILLAAVFVAHIVAITLLHRGLRKAKRNCEASTLLIARLAEDENWGEITIMSSKDDEPRVYKTWVGDGDPQDLANRASR